MSRDIAIDAATPDGLLVTAAAIFASVKTTVPRHALYVTHAEIEMTQDKPDAVMPDKFLTPFCGRCDEHLVNCICPKKKSTPKYESPIPPQADQSALEEFDWLCKNGSWPNGSAERMAQADKIITAALAVAPVDVETLKREIVEILKTEHCMIEEYQAEKIADYLAKRRLITSQSAEVSGDAEECSGYSEEYVPDVDAYYLNKHYSNGWRLFALSPHTHKKIQTALSAPAVSDEERAAAKICFEEIINDLPSPTKHYANIETIRKLLEAK